MQKMMTKTTTKDDVMMMMMLFATITATKVATRTTFMIANTPKTKIVQCI